MTEGKNIELGGNIELVGFRELDRSQMVVVKKMVGSYARKMSDLSSDFEKLVVTLKTTEGPKNRFEIKSRLLAGKQVNSEITDFNLFFALDKSLNKIVNSMLNK